MLVVRTNWQQRRLKPRSAEPKGPWGSVCHFVDEMRKEIATKMHGILKRGLVDMEKARATKPS
ncbi:MAG: hypothetical protein WA324_24670 [Bryobacteraceae bacterium]